MLDDKCRIVPGKVVRSFNGDVMENERRHNAVDGADAELL